jgi:hypothetical protein
MNIKSMAPPGPSTQKKVRDWDKELMLQAQLGGGPYSTHQARTMPVSVRVVRA